MADSYRPRTAIIDRRCGVGDRQAMDVDGDRAITLDEFAAFITEGTVSLQAVGVAEALEDGETGGETAADTSVHVATLIEASGESRPDSSRRSGVFEGEVTRDFSHQHQSPPFPPPPRLKIEYRMLHTR
jgi:hypothetical protein